MKGLEGINVKEGMHVKRAERRLFGQAGQGRGGKKGEEEEESEARLNFSLFAARVLGNLLQPFEGLAL